VRLTLLSFVFICFLFITAKAQDDTIIISKNYKFKIGAKFLVESSGDNSYSNRTTSVGSFGAQVIYKPGKSKSAIESGLYYLNRQQFMNLIIDRPIAIIISLNILK
jgi:hypothetical protein